MSEIDLIRLKEKIERKKEEANKVQGKLDYLKKELKKTWKCNSIEEAKKKLKQMEKEIQRLEQSLQQGLKKLEEKYGSEIFED